MLQRVCQGIQQLPDFQAQVQGEVLSCPAHTRGDSVVVTSHLFEEQGLALQCVDDPGHLQIGVDLVGDHGESVFLSCLVEENSQTHALQLLYTASGRTRRWRRSPAGGLRSSRPGWWHLCEGVNVADAGH
jgi:hypothetical protein